MPHGLVFSVQLFLSSVLIILQYGGKAEWTKGGGKELGVWRLIGLSAVNIRNLLENLRFERYSENVHKIFKNMPASQVSPDEKTAEKRKLYAIKYLTTPPPPSSTFHIWPHEEMIALGRTDGCCGKGKFTIGQFSWSTGPSYLWAA